MGIKYSMEFNEEALRLCQREGASAAGEKLGESMKALYGWQRASRLERSSPWQAIFTHNVGYSTRQGAML